MSQYHVVRFTAEGGMEGQKKIALKILELNKMYEVESVMVSGWSTAFKLKGIDGYTFNSCLFNISYYEFSHWDIVTCDYHGSEEDECYIFGQPLNIAIVMSWLSLPDKNTNLVIPQLERKSATCILSAIEFCRDTMVKISIERCKGKDNITLKEPFHFEIFVNGKDSARPTDMPEYKFNEVSRIECMIHHYIKATSERLAADRLYLENVIYHQSKLLEAKS